MTLINLLKTSSWSLVLLKAHLGVRLYQCHHSELGRLVDRAESLVKMLHYLLVLRNIATHPEAVKSLQQLVACVRKCLSMFGIGKQPPPSQCGMCHHSELAELAHIAEAYDIPIEDTDDCINLIHSMEHTAETASKQQEMRQMIEECLAIIQQKIIIPTILLSAAASLQQQQQQQPMQWKSQVNETDHHTKPNHPDAVAIDLLLQQSAEARRLLTLEPQVTAVDTKSSPSCSPSGSEGSDFGCSPPSSACSSTSSGPVSSSLRPSSSARKLSWIGSGESFNRILQSKRLRFTHVRLRYVTYELSVVVNTIEQSKNLEDLNLCSNDIGDHGAVAIADAMSRSSSLRSISLRYNEIKEFGAKAIAEAIIRSACLTKLDLTSNDIRNNGAIAIAGAIIQSNKLQSLSLGNNEITARGTAALAEAIKSSSCLAFFDLKFNHIRTAGAMAMADCLRHNTSLTLVDLSETNLSNQGLSAILQAMESTPRITVKL